ncbi:MAG: hypothetical protein WCE21_02040 [Candidatus Babeliales bacterium]
MRKRKEILLIIALLNIAGCFSYIHPYKGLGSGKNYFRCAYSRNEVTINENYDLLLPSGKEQSVKHAIVIPEKSGVYFVWQFLSSDQCDDKTVCNNPNIVQWFRDRYREEVTRIIQTQSMHARLNSDLIKTYVEQAMQSVRFEFHCTGAPHIVSEYVITNIDPHAIMFF